MNEKNKNIELIEKYLDGKLKGTALREFKTRISRDKSFAREVERIKFTQDSIQAYGRSKFKSELNKIHDSVIKKNVKERTNSLSKKIIAAIDDIFDKFFEPYEDLVTVRSDRTGLKNQAMQLYSAGNYNEAVIVFKKILKDKPKDVPTLFYCGISLLETEKYKDARQKFSKLLKIEDNIFREQTEWYLGLTYLKSYDINKAMEIFDKIAEEDDNNEAKKIMRRIKKVSN